ncbi:CinA family protein [Parenemella sanctibonifatiensis]|uniref:CinA C-terminal domain-containing protein n=1 Tax=Parenemella sanctibonifatiensis TaxID=2016505 RepID=A0A255EES8_9ACTN|nr:CinA family protein [Parenemella sanctibonifatiensis]OYN90049.1 hypothetical protein CGZ92_02150 [Parenemella sanctibonifatiensis]
MRTDRAATAIAALGAADATLATAESLTGGLVAAALTAVPGASKVMRGGVVAYATDLKQSLLGLSDEQLTPGPVSQSTAEAMAVGVRQLCGADWGVSTTGVAGPDAVPEAAVGTVWVAVAGPDRLRSRCHQFAGDRASIRQQSVDAALSLLVETLPSRVVGLAGNNWSRGCAEVGDKLEET